MRAASMTVLGIAAAALTGGCGGGYVLTVPDQLAPAGGQVTAVVRLQRAEIWMVALPVGGALMRMRVGDGLERGAYTDKIGYAGTALAAPAAPGRHTLHVSHGDRDGDEVFQDAPLYVWDAGRDVLAVDLDCLPPPWLGASATAAAREAMWRLAETANLCYLTRRPVAQHASAHRELARAGYPDGPVLLWQRQRWHIVRESWWKVRVVVESKMVSQLPELRRMFPRLEAGVSDSWLGAKAFRDAGMRAAVVGLGAPGGPDVLHCKDWPELAERGPAFLLPQGPATSQPATQSAGP